MAVSDWADCGASNVLSVDTALGTFASLTVIKSFVTERMCYGPKLNINSSGFKSMARWSAAATAKGG